MTKQIVCASTLVCAISLAASHASAGGLYVPGTGTEAMGRAGAFVAKADNPSALFHNPAGFAKLAGTVIHIGSNLLRYSLTFDREGSYQTPANIEEPYEGQDYDPVSNRARPGLGIGRFQAIPLVALSTDLGGLVPRLRIGAGIMAPNAYPGRNFGDYEIQDPGVPPPPQRYDVVDQEALVVLPSIAAAYSISDKIDVGVRASWGIASLKATTYTWTLRNYEEWVGDDGEFIVDVSDNFVPAFALGALFRPIPDIEIGLAYTSSVSIKAKGEGQATLGRNSSNGEIDIILPLDERIRPACAAGGQLGALESCVDFTLAQTATLGVRWVIARDTAGDTSSGGPGNEIADIELDIKWEGWSGASDFTVNVDGQSETTGLPLQTSVVRHGFKDVLSLRLGGSYALPFAGRAVVARAGIAHDTAAAPDSWRRVDVDGAARTTLAAGLAYRASRFRIDVAGGVVLEGDRTVEACEPNVGTEGCPPGSGDMAVDERESPDPIQPLAGANQQVQDPFNGGDYSSSYVMLSLGVTAWF